MVICCSLENATAIPSGRVAVAELLWQNAGTWSIVQYHLFWNLIISQLLKLITRLHPCPLEAACNPTPPCLDLPLKIIQNWQRRNHDKGWLWVPAFFHEWSLLENLKPCAFGHIFVNAPPCFDGGQVRHSWMISFQMWQINVLKAWLKGGRVEADKASWWHKLQNVSC